MLNAPVLIVVVIAFLSFSLMGGFTTDHLPYSPEPTTPTAQPQPIQGDIVVDNTQNSKSNLQIHSFSIRPNGQAQPTQTQSQPLPTPSPTLEVQGPEDNPPGGICKLDNVITNACTCAQGEQIARICDNKQSDGSCPNGQTSWTEGANCQNYTYYNRYSCTPNSCIYMSQDSLHYSQYKNCAGGHDICFGKPVIYLYPLVDTTLSVHLIIPGYVYVSDPTIEKTNSWTNVTAHPGGKLTYNGKEYSELYYESSVTKHVVPTTGLFIKSTELRDKLLEYTHHLGLLPNEQQEFLNYWMPKLEELNSPYIFFSVLTPQQKNSVDHVELSVEPQTRIEFLAYFKPVSAPYSIEELKLPSTPPKRIGFTEVEWGGTIDK